jgi:hypothetical protein
MIVFKSLEEEEAAAFIPHGIWGAVGMKKKAE